MKIRINTNIKQGYVFGYDVSRYRHCFQVCGINPDVISLPTDPQLTGCLGVTYFQNHLFLSKFYKGVVDRQDVPIHLFYRKIKPIGVIRKILSLIRD